MNAPARALVTVSVVTGLISACSSLPQLSSTQEIETLPTNAITRSDLINRHSAIVAIRFEIKRYGMIGKTETFPGSLELVAANRETSPTNAWTTHPSRITLSPRNTNESASFLAVREVPAGRYLLSSATSSKYRWQGKPTHALNGQTAFGEFTVQPGEVRDLGTLRLWTNSLWDLGLRTRKTARFDVAVSKRTKALLAASYPLLAQQIVAAPIQLTPLARKASN